MRVCRYCLWLWRIATLGSYIDECQVFWCRLTFESGRDDHQPEHVVSKYNLLTCPEYLDIIITVRNISNLRPFSVLFSIAIGNRGTTFFIAISVIVCINFQETRTKQRVSFSFLLIIRKEFNQVFEIRRVFFCSRLIKSSSLFLCVLSWVRVQLYRGQSDFAIPVLTH